MSGIWLKTGETTGRRRRVRDVPRLDPTSVSLDRALAGQAAATGADTMVWCTGENQGATTSTAAPAYETV